MTTALTQRWVAQRLPSRPPRAHKGTFGRVLVVAGSLEYAGAAVLAGLGAARAGAGLVTLATPESVGMRLMGIVPELTSALLAEEAPGLIAPAGWRRVSAEAQRCDALVVGPGLGRQPATMRRTRTFLSEVTRPTVVDADALNALAEADRWWRPLRAPMVLTPHPAEFARLWGSGAEVPPDDDEERARVAREAAVRWGKVVVLKGARTVIATPDGEVVRSDVQSAALATAGSGDVLAGAIGAFLAAGCEPLASAGCGVAVHGAAGLLAEDRIGTAGVLARDIAALLPVAITELRGGTAR
ncbi:MAG TPA: NAD(P)H-hydrate dehydratase [candidate division Zixibacteria bacterium]|nr:NAD(P)H-hydrate dehydratase [candidate division Zixibacteria bacterium]